MVESFGKIFGECKPVYDGKKSMYTKDMLPLVGRDRTEVEVTMPGDSQLDRKFKVGIKFVATVTLFVFTTIYDQLFRSLLSGLIKRCWVRFELFLQKLYKQWMLFSVTCQALATHPSVVLSSHLQ